jgi:hypothetical protein
MILESVLFLGPRSPGFEFAAASASLEMLPVEPLALAKIHKFKNLKSIDVKIATLL